ncbi:MAG: histidine kinase, partial [Bacteroidota bacterium]
MKKTLIILLHLGFWMAYLLLVLVLLYGMLSGSGELDELEEGVMITSFLMLILSPSLGTFYGCYLLLFPKFFRPGNYGLTLVYGFGLAAGLTLTGWLIMRFLLYPECTSEGGLWGAWTVATSISLLCGVAALVLRGFVTWFEEVRIKEELLARNREMELALVKARLDPHFLFNTLNNIDVLILKDPAEASAYLNRLSDIMRFMLYETQDTTIPLRRELDYIEQYVALQRIRTANANYVELTVSGDPGGHEVAPLVFIPFIENAFKHSPNKKKAAIQIDVQVSAEAVHFRCANK